VTSPSSASFGAGTVTLEVVDGVATVTIARPEGMNALTLDAKRGLLEAVGAARGDSAVRALVVTGSGPAFCVGQDLREHAALLDAGDPAPLSTVREHYNPLITALAALPIPTVAAVNGTAAGAGLGIACALDFRIGASGSRYTTAFVGIGLTADSGLSWTLPRLVGEGRARALLLLAEPFTAEQALEMGLLNAVVAPEQVLTAAQELAGKLAIGPTAAYACVKQSLATAATGTLEQALAEEDRMQTRAGQTEDHRAAVQSFLAKQTPVFVGR
jgi:2-(1,2-epoxy-1,2-dihydrophenyl)acetyl-CoA isomerase